MNTKQIESFLVKCIKAMKIAFAIMIIAGGLVAGCAISVSAQEKIPATPDPDKTNASPDKTNASPTPPVTPTGAPVDDCPRGECIIQDYINPAVKALSATVGVVVVISLIIAGIQYSSAGGDPNKIGAAKARIIKTLGAFLFFLFLYVFLNYIVPGGI